MILMNHNQISQDILGNILTKINNKNIDRTDYVIFKNKLIKFLDENVQHTNPRPKYQHLIKNQNKFVLNCASHLNTRKEHSYYVSITSYLSSDVIKWVYSLFDYVRIYFRTLNKYKYTSLELKCTFGYSADAYKKDINRMQLSFKKLKFKNCVDKLIVYVSFPRALDEYCNFLKQLVQIVAINFSNLKQLKIYCLENWWNKLLAQHHNTPFAVYEEIHDSSDYNLARHITKTCAKYLPKLELLHYCSRYHNANYNSTAKIVQYNFNRYHFKVQYDNAKDNIEIGQLIFGTSSPST